MNMSLGRRPRVALVDDDPGLLRLLSIRLKSEAFDVAACESVQQALVSIPRFQPDVVVTDLRMAEQDGIALLKELQRRYPALPVIMMTAHGTIPDAVEATRSGAFAFLTKPIDRDELREQLQRALKVSGFAAAEEDWRAGIVTRNPVVEERLAQALMAASTEAPVLLTGQPGTGKAQLARAIHRASPRRGGRFVTLDCTDATIETFESALAGRRDKGEATRPEGVLPGSLFLDDVAALPAAIQFELMQRLSDEGGRQTVGRDGPRLLSATARNLRDLVSRGQFREDLYYLLGVIQIDLPPLSQRREDIPLLAAHFLDEQARATGTRHVLAPEAVELLSAAEWPGNVRQLASLVQNASAMAAGPVISAELVQRALGGAGAPRVPVLDEARDEFTRNYLVQLLQLSRGNVTQAARLAGRNRTDFYKLLAKHRLSPEPFKG